MNIFQRQFKGTVTVLICFEIQQNKYMRYQMYEYKYFYCDNFYQFVTPFV